jgi:predicted secreted protein
LLCTFLLVFSCGDKQETVWIDESYAGATVAVHKGDVIKVVVKGNPTVGYRWDVESFDNSVLQSIGEPKFNAAPNLADAGGDYTLEFRAIGSGRTDLKMIYHQLVESPLPPNTFTVTISVS